MNNPMNKRKIPDALLKSVEGKIDSGSLEAAKRGDANALLDKLSNEDKSKIQSILNDKSALQKFLANEDVKSIIEKFTGNK